MDRADDHAPAPGGTAWQMPDRVSLPERKAVTTRPGGPLGTALLVGGEPVTGLRRWLLANRVHAPEGPQMPDQDTTGAPAEAGHRWPLVATLVGVDYFSTIAYLPGIAALAAGALSPIATLAIVALTVFGMLPMYRRVAAESPHGQGSIAMLEHLLPFWRGKLFVLTLIGFVATSWLVTITLSASDAAAHALENPYVPHALHGHAVAITVGLVLVLGAVFLAGFSEAVTVAVPLVLTYLAVNGIVIAAGIARIATHPAYLHQWHGALTQTGGIGSITFTTVLAFPLLVLGLSGFETGVSMMPLVAAGGSDPEQHLACRVRNTRRMLTLTASVMSVYLIGSTFVTTLLIPADAFATGGPANGRAPAYLAHALLGNGFGTVYDVSTILILWFAGASAMAGLINIVPRYLPGYGMAPEWARAVRPVVLVYTALSVVLIIVFGANVDAQAGAYATGVLAMMTSGTVAVTISAVSKRQPIATAGFGLLTVIMCYALAQNIREKPSGIIISALFIATVIALSLVSRALRTTELRTAVVEFDDTARQFVTDSINYDGRLTIIANQRHAGNAAEYRTKEAAQRDMNRVAGDADVLFLEVEVSDPSTFTATLHVTGALVHGHRVLRVASPAVPNALAAVLLALRDGTGVRPHAFFEWAEGSPIGHLLRYLLFGRGDTAPMVREVLRQVEPDQDRRPGVHVGSR